MTVYIIVKHAEEFYRNRVINDIEYVKNLIGDQVLSMKPWFINESLNGLIIETDTNTYHIRIESVKEIAKYYNMYSKEFRDELYSYECCLIM
jgi:predicted secreted Zn-dependent protease